MRTAIRLLIGSAYVGLWFFSIVGVDLAFGAGGLAYTSLLLVAYWLVYFVGLWFGKPALVNMGWAMLLGFAIGMIRLLDYAFPNPGPLFEWVQLAPKPVLGGLGLAFICIFVGLLPLLAHKVVKTYKKSPI